MGPLLSSSSLHPPTIILGRLNGERGGERGEMFLSPFSWKWASEVRAAPYTSVVRPVPDNRSRRNGRRQEMPSSHTHVYRVMILGMVFLL